MSQVEGEEPGSPLASGAQAVSISPGPWGTQEQDIRDWTDAIVEIGEAGHLAQSASGKSSGTGLEDCEVVRRDRTGVGAHAPGVCRMREGPATGQPALPAMPQGARLEGQRPCEMDEYLLVSAEGADWEWELVQSDPSSAE